VPEPIRVAIVDDQREIREGLRFLIDATAGYRCAGAFASMEEALPALNTALADVVLCDIGLPGMSGIDGIRLLNERHPGLKLVALTVYEDEDRVFHALCAGASGYLLKNTPPARLLERLQEVMRGGAPLSPEVAARVVALFKDFQPPDDADCHLTPHEVRLLKLLAEGHSYKTAAATLGSSVNTVAFHMKSIYAKLQVHSKSEAVAKALRQRIVR
jgi:DNA-binding NarL/FixJ family response regulator